MAAALLLAGAVLSASACGGSSGSSTATPTASRAAVPTPSNTPASAVSDSTGGFDSVVFVDSKTGWVAGALNGRGVILATTDGGKSWKQQYTADRPIGDLQFTSPVSGWAVVLTPGGSDVDPSLLLQTIDGGLHWQIVHKITGSLTLDFITATLGRATFGGVLMGTTDGGRTWTAVPTSTTLRSVCFVTGDNGWGLAAGLAGRDPLAGDVLRTGDGGRTWTTSLIPPNNPNLLNGVRALWCDGSYVAWASLQGPADPGHRHALFQTTDGGMHWGPVMAYGYYPALDTVAEGARDGELVQVVDTETAVVLGHEDSAEWVQITRDAGRTWGSKQLLPGFWSIPGASIYFADASHGWAVGSTGPYGSYSELRPAILATTDGGQTWKQRYP